MTVTDQMWARGASAPITLPPAPAPPAPPTYFPPTTEGGRPGRGPRRRFPRWIAGIAVLVAVAAAGIGGGWALRGANAPESATQPTTTANAIPDFNPTDARKQSCDAYAALGTQWSQAYRAWLPAVSGVNWHWEDPPVADATKTFSAAQTQIVIQLRSLIAPGTPGDVSTAVNAYASSILSLGAALGNASGPDTTSRIDAVDAASAAANKVCGF